MKFRWILLLSSFLSVFMSSLPAQGRQLLFFHFDRSQNRLEFTTDVGVQPQAELIANPTRVVINLPGIILGSRTVRQQVGGAIREVRVGQFQNQTTRIVIELAPGYTLNPEEVIFRGMAANEWIVQLPTLQIQDFSPSQLPPAENALDTQVATARLQLDSFQVTKDGFFIRTSGGQPESIKARRSRDRRRIEIEISGATLSQHLWEQELEVNRYGVGQIRFSQIQDWPPVVRITLNVTRDSPDWQASFNRVGGIVVLPKGTTFSSQLNHLKQPSGNPPLMHSSVQRALFELL
ncbi:MAG: AMIN domain-containing protein [Symploca sp. SIO2E9]|nr:AMIN domain-containing protein [Symploca sp. SIO2E9]